MAAGNSLAGTATWVPVTTTGSRCTGSAAVTVDPVMPRVSMDRHSAEIPTRFTHMMLTPTAHALCMPTPPATCAPPMVGIALLGGHPLMTASEYVRATSYDRAHCARECRRDDCLMVERM